MPIASSDLSLVSTLRAREYFNRRLGQLKRERESFISHWQDLSRNIQPRRGRFWTSDRNKGTKRHQAIINSTGTKALRTATSGMLAGTMSPTRPWFNLETSNPDEMEDAEIKEWLHKVEIILRAILNESNFYGQAPTMLAELLLFGTGCMSHVDDFENVARFYTHSAGSYLITQNDRLEVDTLYREFDWTAAQIADAFGMDNLSDSVKTALATGSYDNWFTIVHAIEPNNNFRPSSPFAQNKKFKSVYYEKGQSVDGSTPSSTNSASADATFLERSGFDEFPAYCPRWDVTGDDIYGTNCPGMQSLGDVKQLQIQERRKAQAIDKMVHPPLTGPASVRNVPIDTMPGGATLYDNGASDNKLAPLYTVDPRLQEMRIDIAAVEQRINEAFFVDLFLAISTMEGIQPRNQLDIIQRNEERLLQLGPILERIQGEFLDPLINRLFNQCVRANILPPIPPQLEGKNLKVKYISTLAMAQRAVATQSIDRYAAFIGGIAQFDPKAIKKFNSLQAADEYARAIGVPPSIVVPDEIVQAEMQAEAQAQQQALQLEAAQAGANVAQTLSNAKLDDENALSEVTNG